MGLPHSLPIYTFLICHGYIFVFRAALHMVISDFKVIIVSVALGLPFPQVHLSVGGGGGGGGGGGATGFQFK